MAKDYEWVTVTEDGLHIYNGVEPLRTLRSLLASSRFTIYQHQFQFLTEYSVSFYISHFLCTKISPFVSLPYFVLQTSQKTQERLSVQTIRSFKSFLMSRSRSCEIISSLCFLHFGEFLGTARNKQEDLMMNWGTSRITMSNKLWKTKFQKYMSCTVLLKARKEDNKLEKQDRQI